MVEAETSYPDSAFPSEPFACPYCGQMLAASCRVCVACRQAIDPAKITMSVAAAAAAGTQAELPRLPGVRFPWMLFLGIFFIRLVISVFVENRFGFLKTEIIFGTIEFLSALWVFIDARRLNVTRPFRWALGTLLLWPIVFPWYLVRRRTPQAPCPFVEGPGLAIVFVVLIAVSLLLILVTGQSPFKSG